MATISKTGISPGSVIDAQHIINIIEALDGTAATTIVATGSLQGTSSLAISSSYAVTASYALNGGGGGGGGISKSDLYLYLNPTISGLGGSYTPDISAKAYREVFIRLDGVSSSFTINNPTTGSTPMEGDRIVFRINDNGTARNLSWGTSYVQRGASLPTSTNTANKLSTTTLIYNASASKWDCVGYVIQY